MTQWADVKLHDWVIFEHPGSVKIGEIIRKKGRSMVVWWQATPRTEAQTFPFGDEYFKPSLIGPNRYGDFKMTICEPQRRIAAPVPGSNIVTVRQAAAILGTDGKDVRRRLRAGTLKGVFKEGKWVGVDLETVKSSGRTAGDTTSEESPAAPESHG